MILQNNKVKVLHVLGGMDLGGIETFLMNVFRNIDKQNIQFDFALNKLDECYYNEEIRDLGGRIFKLIQPKKDLKQYKKQLIKIIDENGPYDVIHSHSYLFNGIIMSIGKKRSIKTRISHSHTIQDNKRTSLNLKRLLYRKSMKYLIKKNATHFFGCSEDAVVSLHGDSIPQQKKEVLKNGINLEKYFDLSEFEKENFKKDLDIPKDAVILGHIGRFTPVKNHAFILEVFNALVKKGGQKYYLILVGDGKLIGEIKDKSIELGLYNNLRFLGKRKDIPKILSLINLFIFPSFYEGLGISLIEAQASGTKCIISEKIPKESIVVEELVDVKELNKPPEEWANVIRNRLMQGDISDTNAKNKVKEKGYDINDVCELLKKKYYIKS